MTLDLTHEWVREVMALMKVIIFALMDSTFLNIDENE